MRQGLHRRPQRSADLASTERVTMQAKRTLDVLNKDTLLIGGRFRHSEPAPEGQARSLGQSPKGAAAAGDGDEGEHSRCDSVLTGCGAGANWVRFGDKGGSACWLVECRGGTVRLLKASCSVQCGCLMVRCSCGTGRGLSRCVELMQDSRKRTFVPHMAHAPPLGQGHRPGGSQLFK